MNLAALPRFYYFYRTALRQSITLTARELYISQPALSIQIRALEKDLSCQLFWRQSRRKLLLTTEGKILLETCRIIFEKLESTVTQIQHGQPGGNLTLSVSQSFGNLIILPLIKKFNLEYPKITTQIYFTDEIIDLKTEQIDMVMRWGKPKNDGLKKILIMNVDIHTVASKAYLKLNPKIKTPKDLSNQKIISRRDVKMGWGPWIESLPKNERPQLTHHLIIDSFLAQLEAVQTDMGVALLPHYLIVHANKNHQTVLPLPLPIITYPVYLCYLKTDFTPTKIHCFCNFIKKYLISFKNSDSGL